MIIIDIDKEAVIREVSQTTSYTGVKRDSKEDSEAYERLRTTEADGSQLERFWQESRTGLCDRLKRYLDAEGETSEGLRLQIRKPGSFDIVMLESIERDIYSYFVMSIIGRWYMLCNPQESEGYLTVSEALLKDIVRKVIYKIAPERPRYQIKEELI